MARPASVSGRRALLALAVVGLVGLGGTGVTAEPAPQQAAHPVAVSEVEQLASVGSLADRRITSPTPPATGPHGFLYTSGDRYARWDPCTPIRYVVNADRATPAHEEALFDAIFDIELEMGLDFAFVGYTSEGLDQDVPPGADAVIAFSDSTATPLLDNNVLGLGGGAFDPVSMRVAQGFVIVNTPILTSAEITRTTLRHELGHLVGLAHVSDETQLMFPQNVGNTDFGPGDREGLWRLGAAQGCFPSSAFAPLAAGSPFADGTITVFASTTVDHHHHHHHHPGDHDHHHSHEH